MKAITNRIKTAIGQESTWRGFVLILGSFGVSIDPQLMAPIMSVVMLIVGSINVAKND